MSKKKIILITILILVIIGVVIAFRAFSLPTPPTFPD
jgi:uncharacterized membrane protein YczE